MTKKYHLIITTEENGKTQTLNEDDWEISYTNPEYIQAYDSALLEYSRYQLGCEFPFHDRDYDKGRIAEADLKEKIEYLYRHFKSICEDMILEGTHLEYKQIKETVDRYWKEKSYD